MVEQIYRLDMVPDGRPLVVHVSQYDKAARRLSFELYNGGVAYEIPSGAVASIAGTKPDGTAFLYSMAISGTTVSIDIEQQMALVAGDVPAEIQITDSNGKIGSANFVIKVERGPIDEDSVISETDLPIFEELVSEAQDAAQESASQAQNAAASATVAEQAAQAISAILPASAGSTGQVLTKTPSGADWQDSGVSAKANETTLATVESGSTASRAYSVGNYLVYSGQLYKVISAITAGQTLTPGTNIRATSAGAELNALNNDLNELKDEIIFIVKDATTNYSGGWTADIFGIQKPSIVTPLTIVNYSTLSQGIIIKSNTDGSIRSTVNWSIGNTIYITGFLR